MEKVKTWKVYVAYKPCKEPIPEFQWNGYGGKHPKCIPIPGVRYKEDEIGYYTLCGELEIDPNLY